MAPPGEPRKSPKPQPLGNIPFILLFTTCTLCCLFILWRRADSLRYVVSHQLKTWTRREGAVRLSIDDGPPAAEFLEDDDEGMSDTEDDEPLAERARQLQLKSAGTENGAAGPPRDLEPSSPSIPLS